MANPPPFNIDGLAEPRLVTWAAGVPAIDLWIDWARKRKVDPGDAFDISRSLPSGEVLRWRSTLPTRDFTKPAVVPFLIERLGTTPASIAVGGCSLLSLSLSHPDAAIASRVRELAVPIDVHRGETALSATVITPVGLINLVG